jgi:hypothetical protein
MNRPSAPESCVTDDEIFERLLRDTSQIARGERFAIGEPSIDLRSGEDDVVIADAEVPDWST